MKAVITGATGHVGINLIHLLQEEGLDVRAVVRAPNKVLAEMGVATAHADLEHRDLLTEAFRGRDVVFHTAARISITRNDAAEVERTNLQGTRNVLAACRAAGVPRLVHFSSIEAIESKPLDTPVDEDRPAVDPHWGSPYAYSKARAEREVMEAAGPGLEIVVLNPTAIVGPRDYRPSLLGRALMAFARGRIPGLVDGGFDWVDVRDVARAALAAAERAPSGRRYIVGGHYASMAELVGLVCAETGARMPRLMVPMAVARAWAPIATTFRQLTGADPLFTKDTLRVLGGNKNVSHARAERELGYHPRDLADTIRDTLSWFVEHGMLWKAAPQPEYSAAGGTRE